VSIERIQTSIIHIPPYSQEIIDNKNPIFLRFFEDEEFSDLKTEIKGVLWWSCSHSNQSQCMCSFIIFM